MSTVSQYSSPLADKEAHLNRCVFIEMYMSWWYLISIRYHSFIYREILSISTIKLVLQTYWRVWVEDCDTHRCIISTKKYSPRNCSVLSLQRLLICFDACINMVTCARTLVPLDPFFHNNCTNILLFKGKITPMTVLKARQMGYYVMVSLWFESLLTDTRFRFLYFRVNNC